MHNLPAYTVQLLHIRGIEHTVYYFYCIMLRLMICIRELAITQSCQKVKCFHIAAAAFLILSFRKVIAEVTNVRSAIRRAYQIQEADCGIMAILKIACCFSAEKI